MKKINIASTIKIYWKVWRGANKVSENFDSLNTNLKVFLVGSGNTYITEHSINKEIDPGYDVIEIAVSSNMLEAGVYDLKAIWKKNDGRDFVASRRSGVFGISLDGEVKEEEIRLVSYVESFGSDGLSAYETAVMRGLNVGIPSEKEWVGDEAKRIADEDARDVAEKAREEAEKAREGAEAKRVDTFNTNEETRQTTFETNETNRGATFTSNETSRENAYLSSEQDREVRFAAAEENRNKGEAIRQAAFEGGENNRATTFTRNEESRQRRFEDEVEQRSEAFNAYESSRQRAFEQAERDRGLLFRSKEDAREADELKRDQAEAIRDAQESVRQQAEQIRIDTFDENERGRIAAENERKQNEAQREANEAIRQESYKDKLPTSAVVQETGDGEDVVMSQKAVSERTVGMPSHNDEYSNEQWPWVPGSVSPDGKIRTYSGGENWMRTDYLRVDGINSIHAHVYFVNRYVAPIAFYDKNKAFISSHLVPAVDSNEAVETINVPENAVYVILTSQQSRVSEFRFNYGLALAVLANRNANIANEEAIDANRQDIYSQSQLLAETREQLRDSTNIAYSPEPLKSGDILERINAYAYADAKTFFTNQYIDERHWFSLFRLTAGYYEIEQKYFMESRTLLVGVISSEEEFVIGGTIEEVLIGGGAVGDILKLDITEDTLLVLLGKEGNAFSYATINYISSLSIKDKVREIDRRLNKCPINEEVLCCPDTYYAVVGKEFNLYYDGLIKAMDNGLQSPQGIYVDVQCPDLQNASSVIGVRRERMWQIDGSRLSDAYVGEHKLYIAAYNENGKMLSRKECMLVVSNASQLQAEKRILCIGDSLTNNGDVVATCAKHFKDVGGVQPIFIGQRTTAGYKHEGYPGYTFNSFVTSGTSNAYFIFDIAEGTSVNVGDKYSTNSSTYTVVDIRTEGQDNSIRLRCTRNGNTTPANTGILTKVSGASSSPTSIAYSAFEAESGNPFWDTSTNSVNFAKYRERISLIGKFDAVIIMLGTNDCIADTMDMTSSVTKAKALVNAILSDAGTYPTKIILQMTPADANTISSWQVYSDQSYSRKIGYWNNMWNLRKLMYEEFTKDEWKDKVFLGQAALGVDRYYGYPYTEVESSQRISSIKEIYHTNSVHPNSEGYKQLGDGYYLQLQGLLIQ